MACLEGLVGLRPDLSLPLEGGAGGHGGADHKDRGEARRLLDQLHHQGDGRPHVLEISGTYGYADGIRRAWRADDAWTPASRGGIKKYF